MQKKANSKNKMKQTNKNRPRDAKARGNTGCLAKGYSREPKKLMQRNRTKQETGPGDRTQASKKGTGMPRSENSQKQK